MPDIKPQPTPPVSDKQKLINSLVPTNPDKYVSDKQVAKTERIDLSKQVDRPNAQLKNSNKKDTQFEDDKGTPFMYVAPTGVVEHDEQKAVAMANFLAKIDPSKYDAQFIIDVYRRDAADGFGQETFSNLRNEASQFPNFDPINYKIINRAFQLNDPRVVVTAEYLDSQGEDGKKLLDDYNKMVGQGKGKEAMKMAADLSAEYGVNLFNQSQINFEDIRVKKSLAELERGKRNDQIAWDASSTPFGYLGSKFLYDNDPDKIKEGIDVGLMTRRALNMFLIEPVQGLLDLAPLTLGTNPITEKMTPIITNAVGGINSFIDEVIDPYLKGKDGGGDNELVQLVNPETGALEVDWKGVQGAEGVVADIGGQLAGLLTGQTLLSKLSGNTLKSAVSAANKLKDAGKGKEAMDLLSSYNKVARARNIGVGTLQAVDRNYVEALKAGMDEYPLGALLYGTAMAGVESLIDNSIGVESQIGKASFGKAKTAIRKKVLTDLMEKGLSKEAFRDAMLTYNSRLSDLANRVGKSALSVVKSAPVENVSEMASEVSNLGFEYAYNLFKDDSDSGYKRETTNSAINRVFNAGTLGMLGSPVSGISSLTSPETNATAFKMLNDAYVFEGQEGMAKVKNDLILGLERTNMTDEQKANVVANADKMATTIAAFSTTDQDGNTVSTGGTNLNKYLVYKYQFEDGADINAKLDTYQSSVTAIESAISEGTLVGNPFDIINGVTTQQDPNQPQAAQGGSNSEVDLDMWLRRYKAVNAESVVKARELSELHKAAVNFLIENPDKSVNLSPVITADSNLKAGQEVAYKSGADMKQGKYIGIDTQKIGLLVADESGNRISVQPEDVADALKSKQKIEEKSLSGDVRPILRTEEDMAAMMSNRTKILIQTKNGYEEGVITNYSGFNDEAGVSDYQEPTVTVSYGENQTVNVPVSEFIQEDATKSAYKGLASKRDIIEKANLETVEEVTPEARRDTLNIIAEKLTNKEPLSPEQKTIYDENVDEVTNILAAGISEQPIESQSDKKISEPVFKRLSEFLANAFGSNFGRFLSDAEAKKILSKDGFKVLDLASNSEVDMLWVKSANGGIGQVYGFRSGKDIYLDRSLMNAETPIHEFAHIWDLMLVSAAVRGNAQARAIVARGNILAEEGGWLAQVQNNTAYKGKNLEQQKAEARVRMIGEAGATYLNELQGNETENTLSKQSPDFIARVKAYMGRVYSWVGNLVGFKDMAVEDIAKLKMSDWINRAIGDVAEGKIYEQPNNVSSTTTDAQIVSDNQSTDPNVELMARTSKEANKTAKYEDDKRTFTDKKKSVKDTTKKKITKTSESKTTITVKKDVTENWVLEERQNAGKTEFVFTEGGKDVSKPYSNKGAAYLFKSNTKWKNAQTVNQTIITDPTAEWTISEVMKPDGKKEYFWKDKDGFTASPTFNTKVSANKYREKAKWTNSVTTTQDTDPTKNWTLSEANDGGLMTYTWLSQGVPVVANFNKESDAEIHLNKIRDAAYSVGAPDPTATWSVTSLTNSSGKETFFLVDENGIRVPATFISKERANSYKNTTKRQTQKPNIGQVTVERKVKPDGRLVYDDDGIPFNGKALTKQEYHDFIGKFAITDEEASKLREQFYFDSMGGIVQRNLVEEANELREGLQNLKGSGVLNKIVNMSVEIAGGKMTGARALSIYTLYKSIFPQGSMLRSLFVDMADVRMAYKSEAFIKAKRMLDHLVHYYAENTDTVDLNEFGIDAKIPFRLASTMALMAESQKESIGKNYLKFELSKDAAERPIFSVNSKIKTRFEFADQDTLDAFIGKMNENEDYQEIRTVWDDMVNTYKDRLSDTYQEVKLRPFPFVDGFYFPMQVSIGKVFNVEKIEGSLLNAGFLNPRLFRNEATFVVDDMLAVMNNHIEAASAYIQLAPIVYNTKNLLNTHRSVFEEFGAETIADALETQIGSAIRYGNESSDGWQNTVLGVIRKWSLARTFSTFVANPFIKAKQVFTYVSAFGQGIIENKYLLESSGRVMAMALPKVLSPIFLYKADGTILSLHSEIYNDLLREVRDNPDPYARVIEDRIGRMITPELSDLQLFKPNRVDTFLALGVKKIKDVLLKYVLAGIAYVDASSILGYYDAAKRQSLAEYPDDNGMNPDELVEARQSRAAKLTSDMIRATNQNYDVMDKSASQLDRGVLSQLSNMFRQQSLKQFSRLVETIADVAQASTPEEKTKAKWTVTANLIHNLLITPVVMASIDLFARWFRAKFEEDDEEKAQKALDSGWEEFFGNYAVLVAGQAPNVIGQTAAFTESLFNPKPYDVDSPLGMNPSLELVNNIRDSYQFLGKKLPFLPFGNEYSNVKEYSKAHNYEMKQFTYTMGNIFALPREAIRVINGYVTMPVFGKNVAPSKRPSRGKLTNEDISEGITKPRKK